jgi:alkanesulfonate monooxygenase SsuD/methylene tetrahydromethanopterin reductase-like flavin-dependent oxidoreductase (luciferase family)
MEFGMFHEFPSLEGRSETEAFDEAFAQVDAAEEFGLDVMWLAELHFEPYRSLLASPLAVASAIAARTRRMRIGIAVQVLPLCHPLRLAEEAATVDQISQGRLIFGVGRSGVAQTYDAYGVSYAESQARFREILDIVEKAWTEPRFSYHGQYHDFTEVACTPRPWQQPTPPIRIAASTPDTFPRIGRRGSPVFASTRHTSWSDLETQIRQYQEGWREAGHPGRGPVYVSCPAYVAATAAAARDEPHASIMRFYKLQAALLAEAAKRVDPETAKRRMARVERIQKLTYDDVLRDNALVGTPDEVAARLCELREKLGLAGMLAELNCGGQVPNPQVIEALRLLCQEVKPRLA